MSPAQLEKRQNRKIGHNWLSDLLLGGIARDVAVSNGEANGESDRLSIRVHQPTRAAASARPLIVHFHGGGWTTGSVEQSDWLCSHVASGVDGVVVSVGYRRAPQHRWPAAPEDCYAALVDVVSRAGEFRADATHLAVMGSSAGGNLAAVVALMARDRSGPTIDYQALIYPATDLTLSSASIDENANAPFLTKADCVTYARYYLGGQDPRQAYVSPLLAGNHAGLPPALIQVAEHDPIRDDGLRYAEVLRSAGVDVRVTEYGGTPHGYFAFPHLCGAVPQALNELCTELRSALAPAPETV